MAIMISKTPRSLWLAFNIALLAISVYFINSFLNYKNYTLSETNWQSDKIKLGKSVMGAWATLFTKSALCKSQLNLGAWHGYQQFIYKTKIKAAAISFRYKNKNNPFCFIINKSDSLTQGICFHYLNDSTSCFFIADNEGKFLSRQLFNLKPGIEDSTAWNNALVSWKTDSASLSINQRHITKLPCAVPAWVQPGFRGPDATVLIDDVIAKDDQAQVIFSESFSPPFKLEGTAIWFGFLMLITCLALLYFGVSRLEMSIINLLVFAAIVFTYWYYFNFTSGRYPVKQNEVNWHGVTELVEMEEDACARISTEYPIQKFAGAGKVILFIGASQTWGSGASTANKTMPALIEKELRNYFNDTAITVINTGIPAASSNNLYPHYVSEWSKYKPVLTVINLSTNESDSAIFRVSLQNFLEYNRVHHTKTLLVAEPIDLITPWQLVRHNMMHQAGNTYGVKVLDLQSYMDAHQADGFLWWDYVHMTDYGYRLFAQKISPDIMDELSPYYGNSAIHAIP